MSFVRRSRAASASHRPLAGSDLAIAKSVGGVALPDNAAFHHRMQIKSGSSDKLYVVAQSKANGTWQCACNGWKSHRHCRHLDAMLPKLLAAYGGGVAKLPEKASKVAGPVKSRLPPGEAERRKAARAKASWANTNYERYDASGGFGSVEDWIGAAEAAAKGHNSYLTGAARKGGKAADLAWFDLDNLPFAVAGLKTAFGKACLKYHPDKGGDPEDFKNMFAAYSRLVKEY